MRYERIKEFTALLGVLSTMLAFIAALTANFVYEGFSKSFTFLTGAAVIIAASAAYFSIMVSRRLAKKRERRRVFLIYAREDLDAARRLAMELRGHGFAPWLDVDEITPGQVWQKAAIQGLEESAAALVLISQHFAKKGFVQEELNMALDSLQAREKDVSPVVPVRLDDTTEVPQRLAHIQSVNLFEDMGMERLLSSLGRIVKSRGEGQNVSVISLESSIAEISIRCKGRKLSNDELICALANIEANDREIHFREQRLYFRKRAFDQSSYDGRKQAIIPLEQEQEELRNLHDRLHFLKGEILQSSLKPGMTLDNAHLEWVELAGMDLNRVQLRSANLHGARLQRVSFKHAILEDANLTLAKLGGANLKGANLRRACLHAADLRDANLEGADLSGANLTETDFSEANLRNAALSGAKYRKRGKYGEDTIWPSGFDPEAAGAHIE